MDLHLATYFVAVIDHGGITRAAQALYISQPSLSQAIRTLERKLGVTLFDRGGRRLELTEAGRRVEVAARRILLDVERAKARVAAVHDLRSGRVDIVTDAAFAIDPLVEVIREFRARVARVVVHVSAADGPAGVLAALRSGDAELGLIDAAADHATFTATALGVQELVVAAAPDLALPADADGASATLTRAQVRRIPLILDLSGQATATVCADLVAPDAANVVVDCAHTSATWDLVGCGVGATIVPRPVALDALPTARIHDVDPPLTRGYSLIRRSGQLSPAGAAFVAVARAVCDAPPEHAALVNGPG